MVLEKETALVLQKQDRSKTFKLGERVSFSATEFVEICWSLFVYSMAWGEKLSEIGLQLGFISESPENAAGKKT